MLDGFSYRHRLPRRRHPLIATEVGEIYPSATDVLHEHERRVRIHHHDVMVTR